MDSKTGPIRMCGGFGRVSDGRLDAYTETVMLGQRNRFHARFFAMFAMFAVLLLVTLGAGIGMGVASAQGVLSVTASPTAVPARGGETTITVRVPGSAVGDETRVSLSTELGAFTSASGPPAIRANLFDVGNGTLGASVSLVADGRVGSTVVRAQIGTLVDTVTVRFVGETTSLRLDQPDNRARLDASRQHVIRLRAMDITGIGAPSAEVRLEFLAAPAGARLRSGQASSTTSLTVVANQSGQATAALISPPGDVKLRVQSGVAELTTEFQFYGEPEKLRLVPIAGAAIEAGTVGSVGSIQALLLDERGQGVPNQQIVFDPEGGLSVAWDGDGESPTTDQSGTARVHLDARTAGLGQSLLVASWADADRTLQDEVSISVTGPPEALYLRAEITSAVVEEMLLEEFATSSRYQVYAEVVDELGQRVAGTHRIRWRPLVTEAGAQVYPRVSETQGGVAAAIFDLQHLGGRPRPEATSAQAWLISKAQVNNVGVISDLMDNGVPLRARWNDLIWRGPEMTVSEAVSAIGHVVTSAWRQTASGSWEAWFSVGVPGAVDFTLRYGDSFNLVLRSAAMLENVERR